MSEKQVREKRSIRSFSTETKLKSIIFSVIGVITFFVNVKIGKANMVPMVHIMELIKNLLTRNLLNIIVLLCCYGVLFGSLYSRFSEKAPKFMKEYFKKDGPFNYFMYVSAAIFSTIVVCNLGFEPILRKDIGFASVKIAGDVLVSVTVAGGFVALLLEFGFFEFLGRLIEPIMRVMFKLPGHAAIDALSSFVASPAVGVMITNSIYRNGKYTDREATSITTCFSIASLGAFAYLSSTAGVQEYYMQIVLSALFLCFFLAMVMVRIPPLSRKKEVYFGGRVQTEEERKGARYDKDTLQKAFSDAFSKAEQTSVAVIPNTFAKSLLSGIKIVTFVVSLSCISLLVAKYTPIIDWMGKPIQPILQLLGMADADKIASPSIVGIFALNIPALLVGGQEIAAASAFFVVVLSTCQIIFFTESANAMLDSDMPLSFLDLVVIYLLRTVLLYPCIALITKLIF